MRPNPRQRLCAERGVPIFVALCESQNWRCAYCGEAVTHPAFEAKEIGGRWDDEQARKFRRATYDHIIPKSVGGAYSYSNGVVACLFCNWYRQNQPVEKAYRRISRLVRRRNHPHIVYRERGYWPDSITYLPVVQTRTSA